MRKKQLLGFAISAVCLLPVAVQSQSSSNNTNSAQSNLVWVLGGVAATAVVTWLVNNSLNQGQKNAERARQLESEKTVNDGLDPVKIQLKDIEERLDEYDKFRLLSEERYRRQTEVNKEIIDDKIAHACARVEQRAMEEIRAVQKQTQDNTGEIKELKKLITQYVASNQQVIDKISEFNSLTREEISKVASKTELLTQLVTSTYEKLTTVKP